MSSVSYSSVVGGGASAGDSASAVDLSDIAIGMGRVKWFNSSLGYGFISTNSRGDVFVHHSNIECADKKHAYLIEGEFVCFNYANTPSEKHEYQAVRVRGAPLPDGTNASLACDLFTKSPIFARFMKKKAGEEVSGEVGGEAGAGTSDNSNNATVEWSEVKTKREGKRAHGKSRG